MKTTLGAALTEKGFAPRNVALQIAIAKFQNNGGTYGVALAMLNAAYGKGSGGQVAVASNGHVDSADASRLHDGEAGQSRDANGAAVLVPASPSTSTGRGGGPFLGAGKASGVLPSPASRPGHARRGAVAIASVDHVAAKSLFDSTILPDGRKLREVRWSECPTLATKYRRLSRVLMAVHNAAIPPDPNTNLDSVVSEAELQSIIASVEKFNEIH